MRTRWSQTRAESSPPPSAHPTTGRRAAESRGEPPAGASTGVLLRELVAHLRHGRTQLRDEWVPDFGSCGPPNIKSNKLAITAMLVTDVVLLFTMFIGLLRLRHRGGGRFDLGQLLWKQVRWSQICQT